MKVGTTCRKCIPVCALALATFGSLSGADAWTFKTVYAFQGGNDGALPLSAVTETGGKLYGTTTQGGSAGCGNSGCGTVFRLTTTGRETVLASFGYYGADGNTPRAPLLNVSGTLYGTGEQGGSNGSGVVFTITPSGTQNTLHVFQGGSNDGSLPFGGLINVKGTLYGTTAGGGSNNSGTVFSLTPAGNVAILYSFKGGNDGSNVEAGVTNLKGRLYGTTFGGGAQGYGTVFKVTLSGHETVLHSFQGGSDGRNPFAALTNVNGTLYGTTRGGGGTGCGGTGCGTVFKITKAGVETVVYSFQGGSDGANPEANLLNVNGTLFGTTRIGGATGCGDTDGCGTVYDVTPAGAETIIHRFGGTGEGYWPQAGLINVGGTLYSTTSFGGGSTNCAGGCGSVFALSP